MAFFFIGLDRSCLTDLITRIVDYARNQYLQDVNVIFPILLIQALQNLQNKEIAGATISIRLKHIDHIAHQTYSVFLATDCNVLLLTVTF